ncbi:MAG: DoxX family membrane protein [Myxococcota bacterium]
MATESKLRTIARTVLGVLLVLQGINHFISVDFMVKMIPAYLPEPLLLVQLSGVAEILLGALVFVPRFRRLAGFGILALLVAVFPANLQMALHPEQWPDIPQAALWVRLPFQLVFAAWTWWTCLAPTAPDTSKP